MKKLYILLSFFAFTSLESRAYSKSDEAYFCKIHGGCKITQYDSPAEKFFCESHGGCYS